MKYIFLSAICLFIANYAKTQDKHEISLYGMGGISKLFYQPQQGGKQDKNTIGQGLGIAYTFNINKNWGIVTGADILWFKNKVTYNQLNETYNAIDDEGSSFMFNYSANDYNETQNITMLSIPVMAQYNLAFNDSALIDMYFSGGLKFGFPVIAQYSANGIVSSSGYYDYENQTYENLPAHGFVYNSSAVSKDKISLNFSTCLSAEAGLRFNFSSSFKLYAGLYFDYGFNNMQKKKDKHIVQYQQSSPENLKYESILHSGLIKRINHINTGIKIRILLFNWN
jgi:hypothetical protein